MVFCWPWDHVGKIENAVAQQGLTEIVKFIKPVSQEKIGSVLSLADALLVSLKDEFVFRCTIPSKLQTYMASGKTNIIMLLEKRMNSSSMQIVV